MATSGTAAINYDALDIFEEAFEQAGLELRSGSDLRTARRSLNLLLMEWQNEGLNLWAVESGSLSLVAGTAAYDLPADTVDLIEHQIRLTVGTDNIDYALNRISVSTYSQISNKSITGRPLQVFINRKATPTITVWPVPDQAYTMVYYRLRRLQDITTSGTIHADVPSRFLPALIAGLAYKIAMKRPESAERAPLLKMEYIEILSKAQDEDRDRASIIFAPDVMS